MYHSIKFDEKNSWDDWHLIPSTRPVFNPPAAKIKYIDLPGSDSNLDLTTIFSEFPTYENRKGSFEFIVAPDYLSWEETYATIMDYLHGKEILAVLEDNPEYFYRGRFTINSWKSVKVYSLIVIDYDVGPYKMEVLGAEDAWLWDPFDFEEGALQYYSNLEVVGSLELTIEGTQSGIDNWEWDPFDFEYGVIQFYSDLGFGRPIIPLFVASNAMTVTFEGVTYPLRAGLNKIYAINLIDGPNRFIFTGNGTITIEYAGRSL